MPTLPANHLQQVMLSAKPDSHCEMWRFWEEHELTWCDAALRTAFPAILPILCDMSAEPTVFLAFAQIRRNGLR